MASVDPVSTMTTWKRPCVTCWAIVAGDRASARGDEDERRLSPAAGRQCRDSRWAVRSCVHMRMLEGLRSRVRVIFRRKVGRHPAGPPRGGSCRLPIHPTSRFPGLKEQEQAPRRDAAATGLVAARRPSVAEIRAGCGSLPRSRARLRRASRRRAAAPARAHRGPPRAPIRCARAAGDGVARRGGGRSARGWHAGSAVATRSTPTRGRSRRCFAALSVGCSAKPRGESHALTRALLVSKIGLMSWSSVNAKRSRCG